MGPPQNGPSRMANTLRNSLRSRQKRPDIAESKKLVERKNNAEAKKRPALEEITNAFPSSIQAGFSKMLGKTKSNTSSTSQRNGVKKTNSMKVSGKKEVNSKKDVVTKLQRTESSESNNSSSTNNEEEKPEEYSGGSSKYLKTNDGQREKASSCESITEEAEMFPDKTFDLQNRDDPNQVTEYVDEIFAYYQGREELFKCPDYLASFQPEVTEGMRALLVDWLVEVQESFELNHETLYTAVKLLDLYMSKVVVKKEELQLVGATACFVACKLDERISPLIDDFVYVCDDAYTKEAIRKKELEIISTVNFDFGFPLSYRFVRRYSRVCKSGIQTLTLARYMLETALMEYGLNINTSESKLAAAALMFAMKLKGQKGWHTTLQYYSGYTIEDCRSTIEKLHKMLLRKETHARRTIKNKYEHKIFYEVAKTPIPEKIDFEV